MGLSTGYEALATHPLRSAAATPHCQPWVGYAVFFGDVHLMFKNTTRRLLHFPVNVHFSRIVLVFHQPSNSTRLDTPYRLGLRSARLP